MAMYSQNARKQRCTNEEVRQINTYPAKNELIKNGVATRSDSCQVPEPEETGENQQKISSRRATSNRKQWTPTSAPSEHRDTVGISFGPHGGHEVQTSKNCKKAEIHSNGCVLAADPLVANAEKTGTE